MMISTMFTLLPDYGRFVFAGTEKKSVVMPGSHIMNVPEILGSPPHVYINIGRH